MSIEPSSVTSKNSREIMDIIIEAVALIEDPNCVANIVSGGGDSKISWSELDQGIQKSIYEAIKRTAPNMFVADIARTLSALSAMKCPSDTFASLSSALLHQGQNVSVLDTSGTASSLNEESNESLTSHAPCISTSVSSSYLRLTQGMSQATNTNLVPDMREQINQQCSYSTINSACANSPNITANFSFNGQGPMYSTQQMVAFYPGAYYSYSPYFVPQSSHLPSRQLQITQFSNRAIRFFAQTLNNQAGNGQFSSAVGNSRKEQVLHQQKR